MNRPSARQSFAVVFRLMLFTSPPPCLYRNYFTIQAGEKPVLKAKLVLLFIGALCPLLLQIRKESAKVIGKEKSEIAISDNLAQFGGAYRIRTGDLYNANVARYQLR